MAFRCKGRQICPSCHARRVAEWSAWLDAHLLARVAHRQVVLTVPKRLRAYFLRDPRRLGLLSRIATRTLRAYVRAAVGGPEAVPGLVVCVQTFGSVAHFHPHLHVLMTDGAYRRDGSFTPLPTPEPVAESRLRYHAERAEVELVADRVDGPYAGVHRLPALEFVARWPALRARRRRWAELLRMVFQVEVEVCPRCGGEARIVGFVTEPGVVRRILAHLERRGVEARAGPWAGAAAAG